MNGSHQFVGVWVDFTATTRRQRPDLSGRRWLRRAGLSAALALGVLAAPSPAAADTTGDPEEAVAEPADDAATSASSSASSAVEKPSAASDAGSSHLASQGFVLKEADSDESDVAAGLSAVSRGGTAVSVGRPPVRSLQTPPAAIPFPSALQLFVPGAGLALYTIRRIRRRGVFRR